jgi:sirohydrochlorin cobaltochelatase
MAQKIGVMICGHGSRSQAAVDEFSVLAEKLPGMLPDWPVEYGYLEFANPVIRDGLDRLRNQGCTKILAVPGMLFAAMHSKNDIPTVLNTYAAKHGIEVSYGRELGVDPKMIAAAGARIQAAVDAANAAHGVLPLHETALVVIGRGASDPDANSNVSKIARMLWEGMGFGWCEVGYSGVTFPLVEPCLDHVSRLGYKRVIVFPYFLFTGILIDRIYGFTDVCAAKYPNIQFVKAGYLNDHPLVLETFAERVKEQMGATPVPNCASCQYRTQILAIEGEGTLVVTPAQRAALAVQKGMGHPALSDLPPPTCVLCKYRTQVLGFEAEVGAVQESHHHHVEGQGANAPGSNVADCKLCDSFCTGECRLDLGHHLHDHDHDHAHSHDHDHTHDQPHSHDHHDHDHHSHDHDHQHHDHVHAIYPHAKHPLGPESARKR